MFLVPVFIEASLCRELWIRFRIFRVPHFLVYEYGMHEVPAGTKLLQRIDIPGNLLSRNSLPTRSTHF